MLPVRIAGLGVSLPERRVTSAELEQELGLAAGWVERTTGVRERRYATGETTVGLAATAARQALTDADVAPGAIDLVLMASTGPQQAVPCTAAFVQRELGLPEGRSFCFDVNATCLSFLVGLYTAAQFIAQGTCRVVLVCSSEIGRHMRNPHEPESTVLLGDGAAAAVLARSGPGQASVILGGRFATHSSGADLTACLGGGTLHHPNDPATTPEMNRFHMDGRAVFRMARRLLAPFVQEFLTHLGWECAAIDAVVPHQASGPGVDLLTRTCDFRPEQVVRNLATHGNCVAASIPIALTEAVRAGRIRRGQRVLLVGTGAGLSFGAVALTF